MMYKCKQCGKTFQSEHDDEIKNESGLLFHKICGNLLEPFSPENTKKNASSGNSGTVFNDNSKDGSSVAYGEDNVSTIGDGNVTTKVGNLVINQHGIEEQMVETKHGTIICAKDSRICSKCNERIYYKLYDEQSCLCKDCIDKTRIEQAKSLFEEELYEEAITELQNTSRNGYLLPEAMYWIGRCKMKLGNTDEAIKWFAKSKNDVPKSLYYLGIINQDRGNIEKAKDYYHKALEANDEGAKDAAQKKIDELRAAEKARIAIEKAKQEQIAKAKAEQERQELQRREAERKAFLAKEKAERERIAKETYQQYLNKYKSFDEKYFYTRDGELVPRNPYTLMDMDKDINLLYDNIKKQIDSPKEENKKYIQEYKFLLDNLLKRKDIIAGAKLREYKERLYESRYIINSSIEYTDEFCDTIKKEITHPDNKKYVQEYQQLLNSLLKEKEILIQDKARKEQWEIEHEEREREFSSRYLTAAFPIILILAIPIMELATLLFGNDIINNTFKKYLSDFYVFFIVSFLYGVFICYGIFFSSLTDTIDNIIDRIIESKFGKLLYKMSDNITYSTEFISHNKICKWIVFAITSFTTTIISWNIYNFVTEQIENNIYIHILPCMLQGSFAWLVLFLLITSGSKPVRNSHVKEKMPKTLGQALIMYTISVTSYFAVLLCIFGIWYIILARFFSVLTYF